MRTTNALRRGFEDGQSSTSVLEGSMRRIAGNRVVPSTRPAPVRMLITPPISAAEIGSSGGATAWAGLASVEARTAPPANTDHIVVPKVRLTSVLSFRAELSRLKSRCGTLVTTAIYADLIPK